MNMRNTIECWASDTDLILDILKDLPTEISVRRSTRESNSITVRTSLINWLRINFRIRKRNIQTQLYLGIN